MRAFLRARRGRGLIGRTFSRPSSSPGPGPSPGLSCGPPMRLRDLAPAFVEDWARLTLLHLRHPGCTILTSLVGSGASLGQKVRLGRQVEITSLASIGDHSYVNDGTRVGIARIGRFCSIAYHCSIGLHE